MAEAAADTAADGGTPTAGAGIGNPFPGLRPFRTDEEHLFFGRERQIDRMVDKLAVHRFLAVVGTSGSGKSSLVNCGLRPALHRGYMTAAGAHWRMATCRPGHDPIGALARALAEPEVLFDKPLRAVMTAEELVAATLRMSGVGLVDIVEQARLPASTNLLLVVDQFEELFRFNTTAGDGAVRHGPDPRATAFVRLLLEAVAQAELPIYVVLTMRSDYLGDCAQFRGLPEVMNEGQYLVPRLTRDEIRAAITGPVSVSRQQISPLLLTRLLNDVGDNPDQLSILQHALNRTFAYWANEDGGRGELALAHYEAIGTMLKALDRHADKAFAELARGSDGTPGAALGPARQRLAERLFRALTDKGTDPRGIRRPTPLSTLCEITGAPQSELEAVMAVFRKGSRSFLMPPEGEPLPPGTQQRIDISHESLMRVWLRLDRWASDEATLARQFRRLADSAEVHRQLYGQRDDLAADADAGLLSDRELDLALDWQRMAQPNAAWAAQYGGGFEAVDAYIARSRRVRLAARTDAAIELLWRTRWRFGLIAVVALLFIVGQLALSGRIDAWLYDKLADNMNRHPDFASAGVGVLSHLIVGVPALVVYDLAEPWLRALHARRSREAVAHGISAAADAWLNGPAPALKPPAAAESAAVPTGVPAAAPAAVPAGAATGAPWAPAAAAIAATPKADVVAEASAWARSLANRASPLARVGAGFIDLALAVVQAFVLALVADLTGLVAVDDWSLSFYLAIVLLVGLSSAYSTSSSRQATLGKRLLGLIVTDVQGQRLGFGRAFARHLAKSVGYTVLPGLLTLPLLLGEQRRALPDRLAGTLVLNRPPPTTPTSAPTA